MRALFPILLVAASLHAQKKVLHEGSPGLRFANGVMELVVLPQGGAFASFTLNAENRVNLMWDPVRMGRERGSGEAFGASKGPRLLG